MRGNSIEFGHDCLKPLLDPFQARCNLLPQELLRVELLRHREDRDDPLSVRQLGAGVDRSTWADMLRATSCGRARREHLVYHGQELKLSDTSPTVRWRLEYLCVCWTQAFHPRPASPFDRITKLQLLESVLRSADKRADEFCHHHGPSERPDERNRDGRARKFKLAATMRLVKRPVERI